MRARGTHNERDLERGGSRQPRGFPRGTSQGTLRLVLLMLTLIAMLALLSDLPRTAFRRHPIEDPSHDPYPPTTDGEMQGLSGDGTTVDIGSDNSKERIDNHANVKEYVSAGSQEKEKEEASPPSFQRPPSAVESKETSTGKPVSKPTGTRASGPALRLLVITYKRAESLKRLLKSLDRAEYYGDRIDLDIWIDMPSGGSLDDAVVKVADGHAWNFGTKTVHKRESNGGLRAQWHDTWDASVPGGLKEVSVVKCVMLGADYSLQ